MATWILNFVKSGTPVKKQLGAQARQLFEIGLYGLPPNSQAATKIQIGDRGIAYAGAPERVFLADGVVSQRVSLGRDCRYRVRSAGADFRTADGARRDAGSSLRVHVPDHALLVFPIAA